MSKKRFIEATAVVALITTSCGGQQLSPKTVACSESALRGAEELHRLAAQYAIDAGKCDSFINKQVELCPAYAEIEANFDVVAEAWVKCR